MHKESQNSPLLPVLQLKQGMNFSVLPPLVSRELFAAFTGATMDTVRGWAQTDTIPTVKVGRQRLINMEELLKDLRNGKTTFRQGDYNRGESGDEGGLARDKE